MDTQREEIVTMIASRVIVGRNIRKNLYLFHGSYGKITYPHLYMNYEI